MRHVIREKIAQLRRASSIEGEAHQLHLSLWNNQIQLLNGREARSPLEILEPGIALRHLGFTVSSDPALGEMVDMGRRIQVAGSIERETMTVRISTQFSMQEQRFTAAHELGHAVKHTNFPKLHRDRVVNGPMQRRDRIEREADEFASCFLMPAKLVLTNFLERFDCEVFTLNENSVFGLQLGNMDGVLRRIRDTRDVSLLIASAGSYMGAHFNSLAQYFGVSPMAMAIRLEELQLVEEFASTRFR